jgi:predicted nucleic acid-binding protein
VTLIDSNVLVDVITEDPKWLDWSIEALDRCAAKGNLYISDVVYAELAVKQDSETSLNESLRILRVALSPIPKSALFLAGKTFGRYRSAGGTRTSNLPDFFIGAHAQIAGLPILTRDVRRYRTYYPDVELITPDA